MLMTTVVINVHKQRFTMRAQLLCHAREKDLLKPMCLSARAGRAMILVTQLTPEMQRRATAAVCARKRGGRDLSRKSRVAFSRGFVEACTLVPNTQLYCAPARSTQPSTTMSDSDRARQIGRCPCEGMATHAIGRACATVAGSDSVAAVAL